jgi:hypothetical protein
MNKTNETREARFRKVKSIVKSLLDPMTKFGTASSKEDEDKYVQALLDVISLGLSIEEFVSFKNRNKLNICHLATRFKLGCHSLIQVFDSIKPSLTPDQITQILTKRDYFGDSLLTYLKDDDKEDIKGLINHYKLPIQPFKKMWLEEKPFSRAFQSGNFNTLKTNLQYYKVSAGEVLEKFTTRWNGRDCSIDSLEKGTVLSLIEIFNHLKTSPEEYISIFSAGCKRINELQTDCIIGDTVFLMRLTSHLNEIKKSPNQRYDDEIKNVTLLSKNLQTQDKLLQNVFGEGLSAIVRSREQRLGIKRSIRLVGTSHDRKIVNLNPSQRPLQKGVVC